MKQFDVEQGILECWRVTDDIRLVYDNMEKMSEDERMNALLGVEQIYRLKFEKLFSDFEGLCEEIVRLKRGKEETRKEGT